MVPLTASELHRISGHLRTYDPKSAIAQLGGLLTVPALQANTIRIETLVHLAIAHCHGRCDLRRSEIGHMLNEQLGETPVTLLEDPIEDVFVANVETPEGNRGGNLPPLPRRGQRRAGQTHPASRMDKGQS